MYARVSYFPHFIKQPAKMESSINETILYGQELQYSIAGK